MGRVTTGRVLWRAMNVVKEREAMYGPPIEHWKRTAGLVSVLLADKLRPGCEVTPDDWGRIIVAEKLARSLGPDPGLDQLVDIAGYADGLGRLEEATSEGQTGGAEGPVA